MADVQHRSVFLFKYENQNTINNRILLLIISNVLDSTETQTLATTFGRLLMDKNFNKVAISATSNIDICEGLDACISGASLILPLNTCEFVSLPSHTIDSLDEKIICYNSIMSKNLVENPPFTDNGFKTFRNQLFKGLCNDVKHRRKYYLSDFTDSLNIQIITSFIFMYFACLTPIITFGGLLSKATDGNLGTVESLLSGSISGILFALFSGQPMIILGSTGPILVFESIIFTLCKSNDLNYLSFRLVIGLWITLFLLLIVAFNLSNLIKYITKFTEESFAVLISMIYIYEAIISLVHTYQQFPMSRKMQDKYTLAINNSCYLLSRNTSHRLLNVNAETKNLSTERFGVGKEICEITKRDLEKLNGGDVSNIFMWSLVLATGTFIIPTVLKKVGHMKLFPSELRNFLINSSVILTIFILTTIDHFLEIDTIKLAIPERFEPTLGYSTRGWLIPVYGINPSWTYIAAILPAILFVILIFLDQQITALIINKDKILKKGDGYHLDLLIISIIIFVNSFVGIPWFVAATVLSLNHVDSLKTKEAVASCREQRITGILIGITIGISVLLTPILKQIPMSILYGVFILMGVTSLYKIEFIQRISLLIIPQRDHPDYIFLRYVQLGRVHTFTAIQLVSFLALWIVKSIKIVSIIFPLMVLLMCIVRWLMQRIFSIHELFWLDDLYPGTNLMDSIEFNNLKTFNGTVISGSQCQINESVKSQKNVCCDSSIDP